MPIPHTLWCSSLSSEYLDLESWAHSLYLKINWVEEKVSVSTLETAWYFPEERPWIGCGPGKVKEAGSGYMRRVKRKQKELVSDVRYPWLCLWSVLFLSWKYLKSPALSEVFFPQVTDSLLDVLLLHILNTVPALLYLLT